MQCVILQPSYIPWRGYFHQMQKADVFVFYDDVQFDKRGWRVRNRIKGPGGPQWLTIPVLAKGVQLAGARINEIRICWDRPWAAKHWRALQHTYGKSPFFDMYAPLLEPFYRRRPVLLADFTIDLAIAIAQQLGVTGAKYVRSSTLNAAGRKTDRLVSVLKAVGASHYVTGPAAKGYLEEQKMAAAGVAIEYMRYDYPEYVQLYPPYDPYVSILDLLFMVGPDAPDYIWRKRAV